MAVNDYVTVAEIKAALPADNWSGVTTYDTRLTTLCTTASRLIDRDVRKFPGYFYASTDDTRYYDAPTSGLTLYIDELAAAPTSVSISTSGSITSFTAMASTDYIMGPYNAVANGKPYWWIALDALNGSVASWYGFAKGVKVVGKFGYSTTVPADVKQVALEQVIRWFKMELKNYSDYGHVGTVPMGEYAPKERYTNIDGDLTDMLQHYIGMVI
mgnify:CR=1 FL=1